MPSFDKITEEVDHGNNPRVMVGSILILTETGNAKLKP
jgi:hypothetical protein